MSGTSPGPGAGTTGRMRRCGSGSTRSTSRHGPATMLDDDTLVAPGSMWGKADGCLRQADEGSGAQRIEKATALPLIDTCGSVIYRRENRPAPDCPRCHGTRRTSFNLSNEGRYVSDAGPVELKTVTPVKIWTTLAMRDAGTLLAAADGAVIEFEPDGGVNWIEKRRWNSWGAQFDEKFGATICDLGGLRTALGRGSGAAARAVLRSRDRKTARRFRHT